MWPYNGFVCTSTVELSYLINIILTDVLCPRVLLMPLCSIRCQIHVYEFSSDDIYSFHMDAFKKNSHPRKNSQLREPSVYPRSQACVRIKERFQSTIDIYKAHTRNGTPHTHTQAICEYVASNLPRKFVVA